MEEALRAGELHGLICTSSLELGIDIGSIRRVHQLNSPRAVDRMLQRVGRAEHHLGGTGRGDVLAWEIDDIAECAVIARRAMAGELEELNGGTIRPLSLRINFFKWLRKEVLFLYLRLLNY